MDEIIARDYDVELRDLFYKPNTNIPIVSPDGRPIIIITGYCKGGLHANKTRQSLARTCSNNRCVYLSNSREDQGDCNIIPCGSDIYNKSNQRLYKEKKINSSITTFQLNYLNNWILTHIITDRNDQLRFKNTICNYWG